ncbi:MAG: hypothetical protein EBT03_04915 [Betaproteobacteria bacterium]|nr:hypothetical protein [Betaproteobacteria bacterium]NCA16414.1 hypothetical protein [Betaproteobacteria bacterium]
MAGLFSSGDKQAFIAAKRDYELATEAEKETREIRALRIRLGLRCKAAFDKFFVEAAESAADYADRCMLALAAGEEKPEPPAQKAFQTVNSVNGEVIVYLPLPYVEEIFKVASAYQLEEVDAAGAIEMAQGIADKISEALHLDTPFEALRFLRDELEAEESGEESDSEGEGSESDDPDTQGKPGA